MCHIFQSFFGPNYEINHFFPLKNYLPESKAENPNLGKSEVLQGEGAGDNLPELTLHIAFNLNGLGFKDTDS